MPLQDTKALEYFVGAPADINIDELRPESFPQHIAVIMDGNGRWAKERGLSRSFGHYEGIKSLRELITASVRLRIPYVSAYAFSTENWNRPQDEVNTLMALFAEEVHAEMPLLQEEGVKLHFFGDIESLPKATRDSFHEGLELTKHNNTLTLCLAVNYGSRAELVRAARQLAELCVQGEIEPNEITEELLGAQLFSADIPDPDLLIRSSGELRLSNFLLWQLAYTELYSTEVFWPDFTRFDLVRALLEYQGRQRRYGGL